MEYPSFCSFSVLSYHWSIANDAMANNQCCTQFCVYDFDLNSVDIYGTKKSVWTKEKKVCRFIIKKYIVLVWIIENIFQHVCILNNGSCALFTGSKSMEFSKIFIKIGFHSIIYIFKNYFTTMFSIFNNKRYPIRSIYYHHIYMYKQLLIM